MAVHMLRLCVSPDVSEEQANNIADDWVAEHSEWVSDPVTHEVRLYERDGTKYLLGDYRFEWVEDAQVLQDTIEQDLQDAGVSWYRIGYHACDHDEIPGGCAWDEVREYNAGSIPSEVPTFA